MELRFPESEISYWAAEYENYWRNRAPWQLELALTNPEIVDTVQQRGYLDRALLKEVVRWASPRNAHYIDGKL